MKLLCHDTVYLSLLETPGHPHWGHPLRPTPGHPHTGHPRLRSTRAVCVNVYGSTRRAMSRRQKSYSHGDLRGRTNPPRFPDNCLPDLASAGCTAGESPLCIYVCVCVCVCKTLSLCVQVHARIFTSACHMYIIGLRTQTRNEWSQTLEPYLGIPS